jgi:ATP-dependent Clp protease ATP-binding subunit ClpA
MLNQFSEEYKSVMLAAENRAKLLGYKEIIPEDILVQIAAIKSGNIADLFSSFGVNDTILMDALSRPPFFVPEKTRDGDYIGISASLKELIVLSMKVAATFGKAQAGVEDFLIALFRAQTENWFYQLLDFVGIDPKDFENQTVEINRLIAAASQGSVGKKE